MSQERTFHNTKSKQQTSSYELLGSKPKKLIKIQRPNNPSLASYSMKALFGQEKLEILDNKFYQYRNSPQPFSYKNNNPQSGRIVSTELFKNKINNINNKNQDNLRSLRSQSLHREFPDSFTKDVQQEAIEQAKIEFNQRKQINNFGNQPRNSINQLLSKKGVQLNSNNQQRQDSKIKGFILPFSRNSSSSLSQFNILNQDSIRNKQYHGYNIINCIPADYM